MIKVHHLNNSRSQRILWLLEELGTEYEIIPYSRDAVTNLAPPELKAVHPLGKSPVISDGPRTIAESGAAVEYLVERYGGGRLAPAPASEAYWRYVEWLHYAEGSGMLPLMMNLYVMRLGEAGAPLHERISSEIDNHLGYLAGALGEQPFLMGEALTGADIQVSFVAEVARAFGRLGPYSNLLAYVERFQGRPAYRRALEKGGPYNLAA
jgi:glutathione S-transferase